MIVRMLVQKILVIVLLAVVYSVINFFVEASLLFKRCT